MKDIGVYDLLCESGLPILVLDVNAAENAVGSGICEKQNVGPPETFLIQS